MHSTTLSGWIVCAQDYSKDGINSKFVIGVVLFVIRVVLLLIVMFYVLLMCKCVLPPCVNPIAVDKYINMSMYTNINTAILLVRRFEIN
jgi:hypothetical protein